MKCPDCDYKQKVKFGLKCGECGYEFTFNPKVDKPRGLTDGKFLACIRSASQNDTAWFTENQLYGVFCRRIGSLPGCLGVLAGLPGGTVSPSQFRELLQQWKSSGKKIGKLIEEPSLHDPPPEWSEPDIYDYGVERILIVQRDILVDLLVRNGVHAEQRMLVLAESGYPKYLHPVARRLLAEQPDLPVFLLHDASAHGTAMEERVRASDLLPLDGHPLTDLGMFPADFQKLQRTRHFDRENEHRALPVDAMVLPFMTIGLGAVLAEGMTFSTLIEEQHRVDAGGNDFG